MSRLQDLAQERRRPFVGSVFWRLLDFFFLFIFCSVFLKFFPFFEIVVDYIVELRFAGSFFLCSFRCFLVFTLFRPNF